jgi:hypothetical protein
MNGELVLEIKGVRNRCWWFRRSAVFGLFYFMLACSAKFLQFPNPRIPHSLDRLCSPTSSPTILFREASTQAIASEDDSMVAGHPVRVTRVGFVSAPLDIDARPLGSFG